MDSILLQALNSNNGSLYVEDNLFLVDKSKWFFSANDSISFNESYYKPYGSSGYSRSRFTLPRYPELRMSIKFTITSTSFWVADSYASNQNGYKIYFSAANTLQIDRYDSGNATNILTETLPDSLSNDEYHTLVVSVQGQNIVVLIDGYAFCCVDYTIRSNSYYFYIVYSDYYYLRAGHCLYYDEATFELNYGSFMLSAQWWASSSGSCYQPTYNEPSIVCPGNMSDKAILRALMLPQSGYTISINLIATGTTKYATFGLMSPDGKYGVKIKFMNVSGANKIRLYQMDDTLIATSTNSCNLSSFNINLSNSMRSTQVSISLGSITYVSGAAPLIPNMLFFIQTDAIDSLQINSISLSGQASLFTLKQSLPQFQTALTQDALQAGISVNFFSTSNIGLL